MPIPVEKEPEEVTKSFHRLLENCFFCKEPTLYWHANTNTPVCQSCAKKHQVKEIIK